MRNRKFPERPPARKPVENIVQVQPAATAKKRAFIPATKWKDEWLPIIVQLYGRGWTNTEIAELLGVQPALLRKWRQLRPELKEAMERAKDEWRLHADERVVRALYERAIGYSYEEEELRVIDGELQRFKRTVHVPPDVKAAETWLFNRRAGEWRSKQEVVYSSSDDPRTLTDEELMRIAASGAKEVVLLPPKGGNGTTH